MKVDLGFWDSQGNYIPDIQEVSEVEMDKEIIIDGVDVAGCDFYELCGCIDDNHKLNDCKDNPNCHYKQLKRLEQENTELKAENERLKEEIKQLDEIGFGQLNKCKQTLQEIKAIAERNIFLSPKLLEINGDIGQIQNIAITQILDLITKAESEG